MLDIRPAVPAAEAAAPVRPSRIPTVAVLPLRLVAATSKLAVIADIVLDSLVGALATLREPLVISANSTRHLAAAPEDMPSIARRLGADYVVTGALHRLGGRLRLAVELAQAERGAVVWHRAYDLAIGTLFDTADTLAASIAHAVLPRLRESELRAARQRPHDLDAYHLTLLACSRMQRLEFADFEEAGAMLRRAAVMDPALAAPHAALADWYSLRLGQGWSADRAADALAVEAAVRQALDRDGGHARALAMLGHNRTILHRDYVQAQALFDRALDGAPNDAETYLWSSPTLAYTGQAAEAVRRAERAMQLSPEDPLLFRHQHFLSIAHYAGGDYEAAAKWGLRSLRSNPNYTSNLGITATALGALGRREEAQPVVARLLALRPGWRASDFKLRAPYQDPAMRDLAARHIVAAGAPA
jgi:adenylate cyclase